MLAKRHSERCKELGRINIRGEEENAVEVALRTIFGVLCIFLRMANRNPKDYEVFS